MSGTLTFKADMTYTVDFEHQEAIAEFTVPKTCLPAGKACTDLDKSATDAGASCKLRRVQAGTQRTETGKYAVDTANHTFTIKKTGTKTESDEGEALLPPGKPIPFCISGASAKIKSVQDDGNAIVLLLKKR